MAKEYIPYFGQPGAVPVEYPVDVLRRAIERALDALARHISEVLAEDDTAPICIHIAEAYNGLDAAIALDNERGR